MKYTEGKPHISRTIGGKFAIRKGVFPIRWWCYYEGTGLWGWGAWAELFPTKAAAQAKLVEIVLSGEAESAKERTVT